MMVGISSNFTPWTTILYTAITCPKTSFLYSWLSITLTNVPAFDITSSEIAELFAVSGLLMFLLCNAVHSAFRTLLYIIF